MILGRNLTDLIFGKIEHTKVSSQNFDIDGISAGLEKVASKSTNPAVSNMIKVAGQCIDSLKCELESSKKLVSEFEKKAEVRSIIDNMVEFGLTDEYSIEDKVASLLTKTAEELKTMRAAIVLTSELSNGSLFDGFEKAAESTHAGTSMFDGII